MPKASSPEKPWERQKSESEKAFEAFRIYRDMGDSRTLIAVAEQLQKSYTLIRRWSKAWNWSERCLEYDNELQRVARKAAKKEVQDMRRRHINMALQLQTAALEALARTDPGDIDPKYIVSFLKEATRLEKESRIEDIEEQQKESSSGDDGGSLASVITAAYERRKARESADD